MHNNNFSDAYIFDLKRGQFWQPWWDLSRVYPPKMLYALDVAGLEIRGRYNVHEEKFSNDSFLNLGAVGGKLVTSVSETNFDDLKSASTVINNAGKSDLEFGAVYDEQASVYISNSITPGSDDKNDTDLISYLPSVLDYNVVLHPSISELTDPNTKSAVENHGSTAKSDTIADHVSIQSKSLDAFSDFYNSGFALAGSRDQNAGLAKTGLSEIFPDDIKLAEMQDVELVQIPNYVII